MIGQKEKENAKRERDSEKDNHDWTHRKRERERPSGGGSAQKSLIHLSRVLSKIKIRSENFQQKCNL